MRLEGETARAVGLDEHIVRKLLEQGKRQGRGGQLALWGRRAETEHAAARERGAYLILGGSGQQRHALKWQDMRCGGQNDRAGQLARQRGQQRCLAA